VIRYFFIVRLFHSMHHAGVTGAQEEEYSRYCDDEQRGDATQMIDFTTGVKPFGALGRHQAEVPGHKP